MNDEKEDLYRPPAGSMEQLIRENNNLKAENRQLNQKLIELEEDTQASLSAISHELRNSLTLLVGSVQLMEQDYPNVASTRYWSSIHSDLSHMQAFLQDLSSFKSLKALVPHCRLCDLTAFLRDVYHNCQTWFDGIHRRLILSCPKTHSILYADTAKLYQAITNLIKNGLEALGHEGTVSLCLREATEDETLLLGTETTVIEIKDTGVGLSAKQQEVIFQPFFTDKANGTGLGLPIARNIVESHGGKLCISSCPGKGSVFTILLPRLPNAVK
ncbi:HAMP domain-containing histidine kinase [Lacrimispora sp. NSJ-141]|uniref:histidine kinase n=1 Tax=Lientehia hominis TaxID=2897778 RepID=A0AAP2WAM5_9FIRM|nr:HAMP domain-containing sensor histidine kinase [Lientehia hominis]MCD2493494.1 HAMP domain-containing histidine kinase [Lientehia hominis]